MELALTISFVILTVVVVVGILGYLMDKTAPE
jgi:hypothetical protein